MIKYLKNCIYMIKIHLQGVTRKLFSVKYKQLPDILYYFIFHIKRLQVYKIIKAYNFIDKKDTAIMTKKNLFKKF